MTHLQTATVVANAEVCRAHYRLTFLAGEFAAAGPGQFVHLRPPPDGALGYRTADYGSRARHDEWLSELRAPLLRRAFSIAGLRRTRDGVQVDVIYRVVGTATRWLQSLAGGDHLSVLGPLGSQFPLRAGKPDAWLVAGGVGLPPMLWLAEMLNDVGRRCVALCGAQSADLLPLTLDRRIRAATDARKADLCCHEFAQCDTPVVISTDDGSLGFPGHVGAAMTAYHRANPVACEDLVVYACGPERMMQFVAEYCLQRAIECYVCMERSMACGTGLCQSCVVATHDETDAEGWQYRLCCQDGPVFNAASVIWT